MQLPHAKIEAAAGTNDIRYYLNVVHVDADKSRLVATDGHILAVHKVDLNGDKSAIVPVEAFKAARSGGRKEASPIELNPEPETDDPVHADYMVYNHRKKDVEYFTPIDGIFPNVDRVIPEKPTGPPDIILDAELLVRLQRALTANENNPGVKLWLGEDSLAAIYVEPTRVHANDDPDAFGVIMPMRS